MTTVREPLVLRPCRLADLDQIERIAAASAIGIGSLPPERERLAERIRASQLSFAAGADASGEETYLFVLEDTASGRLVGTSGIAAAAGFGDRFYSYRNEMLVHAAQELQAVSRIHTLHLCHDLTGASLLTSFYIDAEHAHGGWPDLLSRARLLFIANHPNRFAERLVAESPGLCDAAGRSPFWDAVGRRFFALDYAAAERIAAGRSKSFIAELMPQYPVYVPLLPADARLAIGQLHASAELPFSVLMDEGFEGDTYVDIFDGGPTVAAPLQGLRSIRHSRRRVVEPAARTALQADASGTHATPHLIASTSADRFRATLADLSDASDGDDRSDSRLALPAALMDLLELSAGDAVRVVALRPVDSDSDRDGDDDG